MSRYTHKINLEGKTLEVAYGYDRPLTEYFIQVFDTEIENEDDQMILWEGSRMTNLSNGEILELFVKYGAHEDHQYALLMDLPF